MAAKPDLANWLSLSVKDALFLAQRISNLQAECAMSSCDDATCISIAERIADDVSDIEERLRRSIKNAKKIQA